MGYSYLFADGVAKDLKEGLRWYRLAQAQNYTTALFNLSNCYRDALGVEKNAEEAVRLCKSASLKLYASALTNMGRFYKSGFGVAKNHLMAACYLRLSSQLNFQLAGRNFDDVHRALSEVAPHSNTHALD
jgi:TPR repeat protein